MAEAKQYVDPLDTAWRVAVRYQLRLRGALAYRRGQVDAACETFHELATLTDQFGIVDPSSPPWADDAIDAHLAAGRLDEARRLIDWLANSPLPGRWPKATAAAGRGALAGHQGDLEHAETCLADAVHHLGDAPMPLTHSRILTAYGAVLARRGRLEQARRVLAEALHHADSCSASWYAERAAAQLRRAGGRADRLLPGQFSPQEKTVARLARSGRTNRQIAEELFLSVNTVETHLAHPYRKLGITRRRELADQNLD